MLRMSIAKRVLIGKPIATSEEGHQRLKKRIALPVFASDAISSTAYATDEILIVLLIQAQIGGEAWKYLVPLAVVVAILLAIVVTSYRQTIYAYPSGGGSCIVAHANLGELPGLVAAAALVVGYILTVSVSIASAVDQLISAAPQLLAWKVPLGVGAIGLITLANLRGIRESGNIFAAPTYVF